MHIDIITHDKVSLLFTRG